MLNDYWFLRSPAQILVSAVLITIGVGAALLLWGGSTQPLTVIDALFNATSATCVTGLLTIPTHSLTLWGQIVLAVLAQIGGLGLITLTLFVISFVVKSGIKTHVLTGHVFELTHFRNTTALIRFVILFSIGSELAGAVICKIVGAHNGIQGSLWQWFFHTVSAFCNAGFCNTIPGCAVADAPMGIIIITGILIFMGGFGFITWLELADRYALREDTFRRLSLHSRLAITTTALVIGIAAILLFSLVYFPYTDHVGRAVVLSIFDGIALRSTGISSLPLSVFPPAALILALVIGFFGSSPASTGSGIKTTVLAVCAATIKTVLAGSADVSIKGKRVPADQVLKALSIVIMGISWIVITSFFMVILHPEWNVVDLVVETIGAYTNTGFTRGLTPYLHPIGKLILSASMIAGRIGALTIILAFRRSQGHLDVQYPEERVMLT